MHSFIVVLHLVQKAVLGRGLFFDRYEGMEQWGCIRCLPLWERSVVTDMSAQRLLVVRAHPKGRAGEVTQSCSQRHLSFSFFPSVFPWVGTVIVPGEPLPHKASPLATNI